MVCLCIYNGLLFSNKKNKLLPFAATWVDLEAIMLSDISQAEKDSLWSVNTTDLTDTENTLAVARGRRWGVGKMREGGSN